MRNIAVIPARYGSSRFPGKPLVDICGKPMIWWVYQQCKKVSLYDDVIVATESNLIVDACKKLGIKVMLTSDTHPTGTDRVAEVAQKIEADMYTIVMGDEPLITAKDQIKIVELMSTNQSVDAAMLTEKFVSPVDVMNSTTIKLAINKRNELIFMSRSPIPYPKEVLDYPIFKNVGCYAMRKEALEFFMNTEQGLIEKAEGIELLRLIENHKIIKTIEIDSQSMSVDTPKDLERIRKIIRNKLDSKE